MSKQTLTLTSAVKQYLINNCFTIKEDAKLDFASVMLNTLPMALLTLLIIQFFWTGQTLTNAINIGVVIYGLTLTNIIPSLIIRKKTLSEKDPYDLLKETSLFWTEYYAKDQKHFNYFQHAFTHFAIIIAFIAFGDYWQVAVVGLVAYILRLSVRAQEEIARHVDGLANSTNITYEN